METYEPLTETDSEVSADEVTEATTAENSTSAYTEVAENTVIFTEERAQQIESFIPIVITAIIFFVAVTVFKALHRFLKIFF